MIWEQPYICLGMLKKLQNKIMDEQTEYNNKIIKLLQKYNEEAPGLRFGQILFNLNVNEFANKDAPEINNFLCRDIHPDSSKAIYNRMKLAYKEEEDNV